MRNSFRLDWNFLSQHAEHAAYVIQTHSHPHPYPHRGISMRTHIYTHIHTPIYAWFEQSGSQIYHTEIPMREGRRGWIEVERRAVFVS